MVDNFFNNRVSRHPWQLKTDVFLHGCLIHSDLLNKKVLKSNKKVPKRSKRASKKNKTVPERNKRSQNK